MRRFAAPLALLFAFVLVIVVWVSGLLGARDPSAPSDRTLEGLRGEVLQLTVESAPLVERFGEWVEAASSLESESRYDPQGRLREVVRYRSDNSLDYRVVYHYEGERLLEEQSFGPDGETLYRWLHGYDAQGRRISLTGYNDQGRLEFKTVYSYDDQGRLTGEVSYNPDESIGSVTELRYDGEAYVRETRHQATPGEGEYRTVERYDARGNKLEESAYVADALQYRVSYRYDEAGSLLEEIAYAPDGSAEYRLENRYDQAGNLTETTEYDADDEPFYTYRYAYDERGNVTLREGRSPDGSGSLLRYEYDYDEAGNWVTRRTFREVMRFGEPTLEPSEVTRRTIRYADGTLDEAD